MDELIKVWDLRRRKEMGALTGHEGTITSLSFPNRTFLLSASEDGVINMYRTRDWALLRTLRGHTGRINSVSAHPSGRVALSVGADRMIRMWDLMRGMGSASVKIGTEADRVLWDTLGTRFAVLTGRKIIVYATNMSKVAQIEHPKRLHDIGFVRTNITGNNDKRDDQHELMLVASESGIMHVFDLDDLQGTGEDASPREVARLVGHTQTVCVVLWQRMSKRTTEQNISLSRQSARTGIFVCLNCACRARSPLYQNWKRSPRMTQRNLD